MNNNRNANFFQPTLIARFFENLKPNSKATEIVGKMSLF